MDNSKIDNYLGVGSEINDNLLLKKIHLKRLKYDLPDFLIKFISEKYIKSNDIRFFNELLWIVKGNTKLICSSIKKFNQNFDGTKYNHTYNFNLKRLDLAIDNVPKENSVLHNNSIALIGNTFHFVLPFLYFLIKGKRVDIINVKYHTNGMIKRLLNLSLTSKFFKILFGKSYYEIDISNQSQLKSFKLPKDYDVGFHKLSFIINDNITSSFNKGLINDHWGLLPFLKGRSTLLYSKLFGVEPFITNHLIDKEIDSGKIICYTPINIKCQKFQIIFGLTNRIYKSVLLLCNDKFKTIDNKKGFMFYEIHPWIINKMQEKYE